MSGTNVALLELLEKHFATPTVDSDRAATLATAQQCVPPSSCLATHPCAACGSSRTLARPPTGCWSHKRRKSGA